ncbi:seryl-tRNA synthetase [Galdieria sulphuraria]|uniref:serine--tRNA ligase n=1 Tax=Galdieria sulphuraria TaxID=130081 RepID=M2WRR4_GALSU|nr:seryl-tRNA synthetase [Galdieria sulphuraria]EME26520.1 seryl-tRNA synthetase [Galdieria sulphuraria]|eukprot:XP_005703040.1 seryl-tRNA synthetase [Galdieria sulphuraria]
MIPSNHYHDGYDRSLYSSFLINISPPKYSLLTLSRITNRCCNLSHTCPLRARKRSTPLWYCVTEKTVNVVKNAPTRNILDFRYFCDHLEVYRENIRNRGLQIDVDGIKSLYQRQCELISQIQQLRKERNQVAERLKNIANISSTKEKNEYKEQGKVLKTDIANLEKQLETVEETLFIEAMKVPNLTHPDVPIGAEEQARVLKVVDAAQSAPPEHVDNHLLIAERLDLADFESAAKVSGQKFYYLKNAAALLEVALINWSLNHVVSKGFTPLSTPDLVRTEVVLACGFQPRGEASQIYRVADSDLCLVGTAEIPLGGYYMNQILDEQSLPIRMVAFGHCFRKEVGSAGQASKGLYRVHQFTKVEMFVLCKPNQSDALLEDLLNIQMEMFSSLGFSYRVLDMPSQDLGNPAYRKFDVEAWMPGRSGFGEISSASNCTDYQARRLNIRYRDKQGNIHYVHTLNATACAIPRMIITILENFQLSNGEILIPEPLQSYIGNRKTIE